MNYNYIDPIQWVVYGGIISAVLCTGIAILWVEIQKEKWIDLGRDLERDSKQPKFRKTKGTRRLKKGDIVLLDENGSVKEVVAVSKPEKKVYKHTNSKGVTYYLHRKTVRLSSGRRPSILYFGKTKGEYACALPRTRVIEENPRNGFLTIKPKVSGSKPKPSIK